MVGSVGEQGTPVSPIGPVPTVGVGPTLSIIASTYLDPTETTGIATPFVFLYALHDALIKPLPGDNMAPCLAESWAEREDGLTYEFQLRQGLTFLRARDAVRRWPSTLCSTLRPLARRCA